MSAMQPKILRWARETAGLSLDDAARALGVTDARGRTGAQRLEGMELGEDEPTRPVLLKMAKTYRRPLLVFYLAEPPKTGDRGQDFRTLPGHERFNPELDALVRDIKARQGLIRSMLEDEMAEPLEFVDSVTMELPAPKLAARMAERLNFSEERYRTTKTPEEAFTYLRDTNRNSPRIVGHPEVIHIGEKSMWRIAASSLERHKKESSGAIRPIEVHEKPKKPILTGCR